MNLISPFFISTLSFGIGYLFAGLILNYFSPKKRNPYYGYRTRRSMQSHEQWRKAQQIAAYRLTQLVFFLCGVAFIPNSLNAINGTLISIFISVSLTILAIGTIEKQLKK